LSFPLYVLHWICLHQIVCKVCSFVYSWVRSNSPQKSLQNNNSNLFYNIAGKCLTIELFVNWLQLSTSLKELLDNWNRSTTFWLRYVIYDRVHSTIAVMFFSAFWHGFYAGYYVTFFTGGLFIHTARLVGYCNSYYSFFLCAKMHSCKIASCWCICC